MMKIVLSIKERLYQPLQMKKN